MPSGKSRLEARAQLRNAFLKEILAKVNAERCPHCGGSALSHVPQRLLRLSETTLVCRRCRALWRFEVPDLSKPERKARVCPINHPTCLHGHDAPCCVAIKATVSADSKTTEYDCQHCGLTQRVTTAPEV